MAGIVAGQVAVVTGGAAGIGLALARAFARRGLRVVVADIDADALEAAAGSLRASGGEILAVRTDVSDRNAVFALRDRALETFGQFDVICNNAGIYTELGNVWELDVDRWRRLFEINYWGVVHGVQAFMPAMVRRNAGYVLNTASMSGLTTVPAQGGYVCAKHAVIALSETLKAELAAAGASGVGVTLLCPAVVNTTMGVQAVEMLRQRGVGQAGAGTGPNLASFLDPDDVAEAALRGMEAGRLYVLPTPGARERFASRVQPIFDAFDLQ